jgi:hypothetical protein
VRRWYLRSSYSAGGPVGAPLFLFFLDSFFQHLTVDFLSYPKMCSHPMSSVFCLLIGSVLLGSPVSQPVCFLAVAISAVPVFRPQLLRGYLTLSLGQQALDDPLTALASNFLASLNSDLTFLTSLF